MPVELALRALGEHKMLRDLRLLLRHADDTVFYEPVERITGRQVRACVSGIDIEADLASELFILHPPGDE